jgi:hypothetical protein
MEKINRKVYSLNQKEKKQIRLDMEINFVLYLKISFN